MRTLSIAAFVAALLIGALPRDVAAQTGTISGTVTDTATPTPNPLVGVTVEIDNSSGTPVGAVATNGSGAQGERLQAR